MAEDELAIRKCVRTMSRRGGGLATGHGLTSEELRAAMHDIFSQRASEALVAAFLASLHLLGEDAVAIHAAAVVMREYAVPCPLPSLPLEPPSAHGYRGQIIDIVGTGGDGIDTFNVSTAAAFLIAGCGGRVAKHGNRAASSKCGSADLLEAVGATLDLPVAHQRRVFAECGFCFIYAQAHHPAMRHVAPIRKQLGIRTIFNFLGPLTNPAAPSIMCTGVSSRTVGEAFAEAFILSGVTHAAVVHAANGMDEISPIGETYLWRVVDGVCSPVVTITPADFGLSEHSLDDVAGGAPQHNAVILNKLLRAEMQGSAIEDFVVMNAACAMATAQMFPDFRTAAAAARAAVHNGSALAVLNKYVALTNTPGLSV